MFSPIRIDDDSLSIWDRFEVNSRPLTSTSTRDRSPSDNKVRIRALLKKYLHCPSISVESNLSNDRISLDESLSTVLPETVSISPTTSITFQRDEEQSNTRISILTELLPKVTYDNSSRGDSRSPILTHLSKSRTSSQSSSTDPQRNIWLSALSVTPDPPLVSIQVPIQVN